MMHDGTSVIRICFIHPFYYLIIKMKIGIVTVALSHGGAERVAATLANGFSQKGNQVILLTDLNEPIDYYPDTRVKLVGVLKDKKQGLKRWINAISAIRKTIKQERPDIIIGIMGLCTFSTYIACLGLRIPIVMTEHFAFDRTPYSDLTFIEKMSKFYVNKLYNAVTVLTEADKRVIGNQLSHVYVMPNPLALRPVTQLTPRRKIVLAAGRLEGWKVKGFDVLIKAWKSLSTTFPRMEGDSWWLKIAGAGKQESFESLMGLLPDGEWESQNRGWKSEKYHIEFLGFQTEMEILYKKAEIFVLSSRYEGFGLVLIEAMSQGCAPIACDYKGRQREIFEELKNERIEELKNGSMEVCENGILCEPDNVDALASALTRMMEDDSYRKSVQTNAIERSKAYSINNIMNRWDVLIKEVLSRKRLAKC